MRIVTLEPFLTELVLSLGLKEGLVGISGGHDFSSEFETALPIVTEEDADIRGLGAILASHPVDLEVLKELAPDVVLARLSSDPESKSGKIGSGPRSCLVPAAVEEASLQAHLGDPAARLLAFDPRRLEDIYEMTELAGTKLNAAAKGREKSQRMKAQFMDWADNFYERCKNKKVVVLSSIEPLQIGGLWIPDMIQLSSAISLNLPGNDHAETKWDEIVRFRPDVIVIAPQGKSLKETVKYFDHLAKLPNWEEIPAVKRSEVIFTDGLKFFYRPSPRLVDSMAILISAIAGLESGYITERDSFFKLRWLELHRHKL